MKRINRRTSMDCLNWDKVEHNNELADIEKRLKGLVDYECIVFKRYLDNCNKHREVEIFKNRLHKISDLYEMADSKYGVDICVDDDDFINVMVFGEGYEDTEGFFHSTCAFKIIPMDHKGNIINVGRYVEGKPGITVKYDTFSEFAPRYGPL